MKCKLGFLNLVFFIFLSCACVPRIALAADEPNEVRYSIDAFYLFPGILAKIPRIRVSMAIHIPEDTKTVRVRLPTWSMSDSRIQHHAQYIRVVQAHEFGWDEGVEPTVHRLNTDTWEINTEGCPQIALRYYLDNRPPGIPAETIQLTPTGVFANGAAMLLYVVGQKDAPVTLRIFAPDDAHVVVSLPASQYYVRTYTAPNYDALADAQFLITKPRNSFIRTFKVGSTTFRTIFFHHAGRIKNPDAYTPVIQKIVQDQFARMGPMPTSHYDFFFDVDGRGSCIGHQDACRIALPSAVSPGHIAPRLAREFFHLWNRKRIRP